PQGKPAATSKVAKAPTANRARKVKQYKNPNTGETIETKGGNHKTLKSWKEQYGAETVESWATILGLSLDAAIAEEKAPVIFRYAGAFQYVSGGFQFIRQFQSILPPLFQQYPPRLIRPDHRLLQIPEEARKCQRRSGYFPLQFLPA